MERQETGQVPLREWLRSGKWLAGLAGGAIAAPIGIQLHELGHFAVNVACGFPDNVLRYASVSWTGSSEFRRLWRAVMPPLLGVGLGIALWGTVLGPLVLP